MLALAATNFWGQACLLTLQPGTARFDTAPFTNNAMSSREIISRAKQIIKQVKHRQLLVSLAVIGIAGTAALAFQQSHQSGKHYTDRNLPTSPASQAPAPSFNSGSSVIPFSSGGSSGGSSSGSSLEGSSLALPTGDSSSNPDSSTNSSSNTSVAPRPSTSPSSSGFSAYSSSGSNEGYLNRDIETDSSSGSFSSNPTGLRGTTSSSSRDFSSSPSRIGSDSNTGSFGSESFRSNFSTNRSSSDSDSNTPASSSRSSPAVFQPILPVATFLVVPQPALSVAISAAVPQAIQVPIPLRKCLFALLGCTLQGWKSHNSQQSFLASTILL